MVVSADLSSRCALINEEMFGNRARLLFLRPEPFPGTTGEWKPQMTVTVVCETIPYWFLRLLLQQQQCVALFGNGGGNGGSQISANISKGRDCFCSMALPVDLLRLKAHKCNLTTSSDRGMFPLPAGIDTSKILFARNLLLKSLFTKSVSP